VDVKDGAVTKGSNTTTAVFAQTPAAEVNKCVKLEDDLFRTKGLSGWNAGYQVCAPITASIIVSYKDYCSCSDNKVTNLVKLLSLQGEPLNSATADVTIPGCPGETPPLVHVDPDMELSCTYDLQW